MRRFANRIFTNLACNATTPRPRAFSLRSASIKTDQGPGDIDDFTSWPMLTDRRFSSRHIPPKTKTYIDSLPFDAPPLDGEIGQITELFLRKGAMQPSRSSSLFMFFAQWFTDSFLRVDQTDRRKNTSNHNLDLCQIYGLDESTASILRSHQGGKLRCKIVNGESYLDNLFEPNHSDQWRIKPHYQDLPYVQSGVLDNMIKQWPDRQSHWYATGLERGNSSIGYAAISTLFLREHNRLCDELQSRYPNWSDERLFQTARNINIVLMMKIVVVDYINHIVGYPLFVFDRHFAEKQKWYRTPWISLEFNMLYRWHGLIPDHIMVNNDHIGHRDYRFNNALLEQEGLNDIIASASASPAGEISLENVPEFMMMAEYQNIKMGRDFRLASYNDYREHFGLKPMKSFQQLTGNRHLANKLQNCYGNIDKLELIVGLFAEKRGHKRLYGELMYTMVAYDAFTQVYTNPLLASNVFNAGTFSQLGLETIEKTSSLQDLVNRNCRSVSQIKAVFGYP